MNPAKNANVTPPSRRCQNFFIASPTKNILLVKKQTQYFSCASVVVGVIVMPPHYDTMDGPVVKACRKALETGNVNLILPWIPEAAEGHGH